MSVSRKLKLCREFGVNVVLSDLLATNIRIPRITSRYKDRVILDWFREHYGQVIEEYRSITSPTGSSTDSSSLPVWSMWLQGEGNAPEIVRLCLASTRSRCGTHPFHVITSENLGSYLSLPGYVHGRLRDGSMKTAHFSDIVRMALLAEWGGLWLDATIFTASDIPDEVFAHEYYTVRHTTNIHDRNVALQRWTTYLQASHRNNILCRFVRDMLLEYWKNHTTFIDYVMTDYIIALAYEDLPICRELLDAVPMNNPRIEDMRPLLGTKYIEDVYDELTSDTCFFKLTYKQNFPESAGGRETFYAHILSRS
ncbi:MAG: capsular polysaccharide synthesis protein [Synergistaceae bacterium]|nr:capsular polysaccharide synthesis protein [Synergistaceae bacterium]